jgi:hypothetical protein
MSNALLTALHRYIKAHGVAVRRMVMAPEKPAEFDGLRITLNPTHDVDSLAYYLAHSYGSIVAWSVEPSSVQAVFDELRDAKTTRSGNPERLERALQPFRQFEARTSEYAVWVLEQAGFQIVIPDYTVFFRADIEAITIFHRTGRAPVWRLFLAQWKDEIARGVRSIDPFPPRAVPPTFSPMRIDLQEVKQGL